MLGDSDRGVRILAAEALHCVLQETITAADAAYLSPWRMRGTSASVQLVELLRREDSDTMNDVAYLLCELLSVDDDARKQAFDPLIALVQHGTTNGFPFARYTAARALGVIKDPRSVATLCQVLKTLGPAPLDRAVIEDRHDIVRYHIAWALGEMGFAARDAIPLLRQLRDENRVEVVKEQARFALSKIEGMRRVEQPPAGDVLKAAPEE
jgi:HEAT repeat protein